MERFYAYCQTVKKFCPLVFTNHTLKLIINVRKLIVLLYTILLCLNVLYN